MLDLENSSKYGFRKPVFTRPNERKGTKKKWGLRKSPYAYECILKIWSSIMY